MGLKAEPLFEPLARTCELPAETAPAVAQLPAAGGKALSADGVQLDALTVAAAELA